MSELEKLERAVVDAAVEWHLRIKDPPNMWADTEDLALIESVESLKQARERIGLADHPFQPHHLAHLDRYADYCVEAVRDDDGLWHVCRRPRAEHRS